MVKKLVGVLMALLLMVFGVSTVSAQGSTVDLKKGLTHYYTFNNPDNLGQDYSGNGNNATVKNGVKPDSTHSVSAKMGETAAFDGDNGYIELPTNIFEGINDVTVSVWAYFNSFEDWARIFEIGQDEVNCFNAYSIWSTDDVGKAKLIGEITNAATQHNRWTALQGDVGTAADAPDTSVIEKGKWIHVAISSSADNVAKLYLNGVCIEERSVAYSQKEKILDEKNNPLAVMLTTAKDIKATRGYLGKSFVATDPYFNGYMDDFMVHNRILSDAEIKALYDSKATLDTGVTVITEQTTVQSETNTTAQSTTRSTADDSDFDEVTGDTNDGGFNWLLCIVLPAVALAGIAVAVIFIIKQKRKGQE